MKYYAKIRAARKEYQDAQDTAFASYFASKRDGAYEEYIAADNAAREVYLAKRFALAVEREAIAKATGQ